MQSRNHFTTISFPNPVSFEFKKTDDGQKIKLTFDSHIKMKEFVNDVIEKSYVAFNIPTTKSIHVIENSAKGENGEPLDTDDETLLRVKYAYNYKQTAFYIHVIE
jgi:hypothetical protein